MHTKAARVTSWRVRQVELIDFELGNEGYCGPLLLVHACSATLTYNTR